MANTKEYKIVINGITESVNAVKALEKELFNLEERIKSLEAKSVNIKTGSSGGGGSSRTSNASSLSEEEKLEKQILQTEAKREAYSKEIYQNYLAAKELLDETVKDQKQLAAAERLSAGAYSNTMQGMKQELADIKAVMQTVDLGDTDQFDKLTKRANELNEALKKIEESYGQFGRNVGNYKDALEGLNNITVTIGGVAQSFDNLKQAAKAIRDEMGKLEYNNKQNTQEYKNLEKELDKVTKAQLRLNSAMNDAKSSSKAMDDLLDTMESFVAIGQVGRGFSTFFGLDNTELEKQIAKLVALQNMLQGIEKLRKQMNTKEGIGGWFTKGGDAVDKFVTKLTGAQKRMGLFVSTSKNASAAVNGLANALKGILATGAIIGMPIIVSVIGNIVEKLKDYIFGGLKAGEASEILANKIEMLNNKLKQEQWDNANVWMNNFADGERKAAADAVYLSNNLYTLGDHLKELLKDLKELRTYESSFDKAREVFGLEGVDTESLDAARTRFEGLLRTIAKIEEKAKKSILPEWLQSMLGGEYSLNNLRKDAKQLGDAIITDYLARANDLQKQYNEELKNTGKVSDETKAAIQRLNKEANEDFATNSVLNNVEKFSNKGEWYVTRIAAVKDAINELNTAVNSQTTDLDPGYLAQLKIDAMKEGRKKIEAQNELNRKKEIEQANGNLDAINLINQKYDQQLKQQLKSTNESYLAAQNDLARLRIELMRESLKKQLKELEQERKEKIQAIQKDGNLVGARIEATNKLYDKKILDAKKEWAKQVVETYENMYASIQSVVSDNMQTEVSTANQNTERKRDQDIADSGFFYAKYDDTLRNMKDYYTEVAKIEQDAAKKLNAIRKEELDKQYEFDSDEENLRHKRMADAETTALVMEKLAKYEEENGVPLVPESAEEDWAKLESELQSNLDKMSGELVDAYNKGELSFKDFVGLIEKEQDAHNSNMNALQKEYNSNVLQNDQELTDSMRASQNKRFQSLIAQARQSMDKLGNVMSQQPIKDEEGWGVVNIKKTSENYKKVIEGYKNTSDYLVQLKEELKQKLDNKEITAEDYFARKAEIDAAIKASEEASKGVAEKQKDVFGEFLRSIEQYIQAVGQGIQQIMSAVWDAQDREFDNEARQLDKLNERLEKAMDKNEEILERHKQNVDSIEDELQTARGARREHLIDQLNAEVIAERRAAAEKKKIEKEQEALKKKQDELDKKRQMAQYQRELTSILVSGALATINAYATKPFVPVGLAMGSLSLGIVAAQYAIAKANPPKFAKGGLLEGPSHAQGGIRAGGVELEGNEYVVNKHTTMQNIDLLEYINSNRKKLNISDLIEFYQGDKPRKAIQGVRTRFADGGSLPTLRTDIDVSGGLEDAFKEYAKTPSVVQVVDIVDKTKQYNNVKVLAGLAE